MHAAVTATRATAALVHRQREPFVGLVTSCAHGPGAEEELGQVVPRFDPVLATARTGRGVLGRPNGGELQRCIARRFDGCGALLEGVAMVPADGTRFLADRNRPADHAFPSRGSRHSAAGREGRQRSVRPTPLVWPSFVAAPWRGCPFQLLLTEKRRMQREISGRQWRASLSVERNRRRKGTHASRCCAIFCASLTVNCPVTSDRPQNESPNSAAQQGRAARVGVGTYAPA